MANGNPFQDYSPPGFSGERVLAGDDQWVRQAASCSAASAGALTTTRRRHLPLHIATQTRRLDAALEPRPRGLAETVLHRTLPARPPAHRLLTSHVRAALRRAFSPKSRSCRYHLRYCRMVPATCGCRTSLIVNRRLEESGSLDRVFEMDALVELGDRSDMGFRRITNSCLYNFWSRSTRAQT